MYLGNDLRRMTHVFPSEIIRSEINDQPLLSETVSIHSGMKETWNTIENSLAKSGAGLLYEVTC